ncbi:MAG TPA: hypothetical protein VN643_24865 [Pyrinomonadaceae bacterium]|nr:hypothetical protein [Pyrinomonadaceae bacterium]
MDDQNLTPELFEQLLDWLNPVREQAGQEYENIRRRLIKYFTCRRCFPPEDAADETMNRVAKKLAEIKDSYVGPRPPYFYKVASLILLECRRIKTLGAPPIPLTAEEQSELEQRHGCLDQCMEDLSNENREIVLEYYQQEKRAKIDRRKRLAEKLGISLNALRIRAFRVRALLQECVLLCVSRPVLK